MRAEKPVTSEVLRKLFSFVDLTDLRDNSTEETIAALCSNAELDGIPAAAVCVWPRFIETAAQHLKHLPTTVATVINFPCGTRPLQFVVAEIETAIEKGAEEIDLVFPRHLFLAGNMAETKEFLVACRNAAFKKTLKIILESGAFLDPDNLASACHMACEAGADFLKTSTGKLTPGATPAAATTILRVIQSAFPTCGLKISGGIRTKDQAMAYLALANGIMGETWATPANFRIGTSQLTDNTPPTSPRK